MPQHAKTSPLIAPRERNWGVDLLRIVSMLLIVLMHVLNIGGVAASVKTGSAKYIIVELFYALCYCCVNCYALISGYVGIKGRYKYTNIVMIWLQVIFYTLLITLIYYLVSHNEIPQENMLKAFFPVMCKEYWYISSYVGLFFLMPILNIAINKASFKQLLGIILPLFVIFNLLPFFPIFKDISGLGGGYSVIWLMYLYLIGGFLSKFKDELEKISNFVLVALYIITTLLLFVGDLLNDKEITFFKELSFLSYTSPICVIQSVCMMILFSRMKLNKLVPLVKFFAPLTLGVFLIHVHTYVWYPILKNRFVSYAQKGTIVFVLYVILTVVGIYIACSLIDFIRNSIFKALKLKERIYKLELKTIGDVWGTKDN